MVDRLLGVRKSVGDQLCLVVCQVVKYGSDVLDLGFSGFLLAFMWSLGHQYYQETSLGFYLTGVLVNRWGLLPISLGNSSQCPATLGFPWYSSQ